MLVFCLKSNDVNQWISTTVDRTVSVQTWLVTNLFFAKNITIYLAFIIIIIFFFFEGLYFQENFIWKTSILKTRTIKSLKEEEIFSANLSKNKCVAM